MFSATFVDSGLLLKKIIEFINYKDFLQEVNFVFTESVLFIQSMDSSHISLIDITVKKDRIKNYTCNTTVSLGINLDLFTKILKSSPNNTDCRLTLPDDNTLQIEYFTTTTCVSKYKLKLIDIQTDRVQIPTSSDYKCSQDLNFIEFNKQCQDLSLFGDEITIQQTTDNLVLSTNNDLVDATLFCKGVGGNCVMSVVLSVKYLLWFSKVSGICDKLLLHLDDGDKPIFFQPISVGDSSIDFKFFLSAKETL